MIRNFGAISDNIRGFTQVFTFLSARGEINELQTGKLIRFD